MIAASAVLGTRKAEVFVFSSLLLSGYLLSLLDRDIRYLEMFSLNTPWILSSSVATYHPACAISIRLSISSLGSFGSRLRHIALRLLFIARYRISNILYGVGRTLRRVAGFEPELCIFNALA